MKTLPLLLVFLLLGCQNPPSTTQSTPVKARILDVQIVPVPATSSLMLNARPVTGDPDPQYVTSWQFSAAVQASDQKPKKVVWTVSDPTRLMVNEDGLVQTMPGAPQGEVTVKATSADDPNLWDDIKILVTRYGDVALEVR